MYLWYGGKRKGKGKPPKWVEKLLHGNLKQELSSDEKFEPHKEDIEGDSEATRAIEVSEVEPGEDDGLAEPKPVGEIKEDTLEITSSPRERELTVYLEGQSSPPEDTYEGCSGRGFIRRVVM